MDFQKRAHKHQNILQKTVWLIWGQTAWIQHFLHGSELSLFSDSSLFSSANLSSFFLLFCHLLSLLTSIVLVKSLTLLCIQMGGGYPQSVAVSEAGDMGRRGQYASAPSPRNSLVQVSVAILFFFLLLLFFLYIVMF